MTADRAMDNTLLPSIRALWRFFVIRFLAINSCPLRGRFRQLLRGNRSGRLTDANLYDTLHAELSFETGDDDAAMSLAQACLGRHPSRELACRLHRLLCQCLFNQGDTEAALQHLEEARRYCGARDRHLPPPLN